MSFRYIRERERGTHMDLEIARVGHRADARQQVAVPPAVNR
jgi:hypothetical protein